MLILPKKYFAYEGEVPSDKSITHRAVMLNSIARGSAVIRKPLLSLDTLATIACMKKLGAAVSCTGDEIHITGTQNFTSGQTLNAENSGTTMRILTGLLSGLGISAALDGDRSLRKRPMNRVISPLTQLGAKISSENGYAPLAVSPADLTGREITLEVPSAQVKSAVLLAGLFGSGETTVRMNTVTRDHTERMLGGMGADIACGNGYVSVKRSSLIARDITVCGDISSAAFPLALGALLGRCKITGVGVNPTRAGILDVLDLFGAKCKITNPRTVCGEPVADIEVTRAELKPVKLGGGIIANIVDEIPIIAVLACFANGTTEITGAGELRIKESDRIKLLHDNLTGMGGQVQELPDGLRITGTGTLSGNRDFICRTAGDHRIAMCMAVAALASRAGGAVDDFDCVNVSFPNFGNIVGVQ